MHMLFFAQSRPRLTIFGCCMSALFSGQHAHPLHAAYTELLVQHFQVESHDEGPGVVQVLLWNWSAALL